MKRAVSCILAALVLVVLFSISASGAYSKNSSYTGMHSFIDIIAGTDNPGSVNSAAASNAQRRIQKDEIFLKMLYREFLKENEGEDCTKDELRERFEDYLKENHFNPDQFKNYDDIIEDCFEEYEDMDPNEYDFFADYDIDELIDEYLKACFDDAFYEDYAEYFDD